MVEVILTLILAVVVGVAVSLLGGGGSILMAPILTYVTGLPANQAIAMSLFVVEVTSLFSMALHSRRKNVRSAPALSLVSSPWWERSSVGWRAH